jgi:hypothetical protein
MKEEKHNLGNGLVAIAQPFGRGYKVYKQDNIHATPNVLRKHYGSLAEAREDVSKYLSGKLWDTKKERYIIL